MARQLRCPVCYQPLSVGVDVVAEKKVIWLFCTHGPCPCYPMNDGGEGATLEAAQVELLKKYDEWCKSQPE